MIQELVVVQQPQSGHMRFVGFVGHWQAVIDSKLVEIGQNANRKAPE